jgi:hypothetical protein
MTRHASAGVSIVDKFAQKLFGFNFYLLQAGPHASRRSKGIDMSGHPIIAVGALSADSAAIRAALPGDIDDPFCWIGRFAEDDVYLCC